MTLHDWLTDLIGVLGVTEAFTFNDQFPVHQVRLMQGNALVLLVKPDSDVFALAQTLITALLTPLLVLVDAPPPADGATIENWYDDHQVEKMLHALFFGRVYYWHDERVTAVHFVSDSGFNRRVAQHAPPSTYPFDHLQISRPHDCFDSALSGYEWRTVSFGEQTWWESHWQQTQNTYTAGGANWQHQRPPHTEPPPNTGRGAPPMTDAEWQEYLARIRARAEQATYWQNYAAPPPSPVHGNRYQQALATLGLSADATPEQIKAAYRKKALETHPDTGGNHDLFIQIQQAYEYLTR